MARSVNDIMEYLLASAPGHIARCTSDHVPSSAYGACGGDSALAALNDMMAEAHGSYRKGNVMPALAAVEDVLFTAGRFQGCVAQHKAAQKN